MINVDELFILNVKKTIHNYRPFLNFREAVIRCFHFGKSRGKSGHHRAEFLVKTRGTYFKLSSRLVQQKINHPDFRERVKRWGKSPPPQRQQSGQCKPNSMQGEIGNRVARPLVSGTPHLHSRRINVN